MSGIGRNVKRAIRNLLEKDYEGSAAAIFPAVDATGKRRYPKLGSGPRFKKLIDDQEDILTYAALRNVITRCSFDGIGLSQALWEFSRCPLVHDSEIGEQISFDDSYGVIISAARWNLPPSYLQGIILSVVSAKENSNEDEELFWHGSFGGKRYALQTLWGGEDFLRAIIKVNCEGRGFR